MTHSAMRFAKGLGLIPFFIASSSSNEDSMKLSYFEVDLSTLPINEKWAWSFKINVLTERTTLTDGPNNDGISNVEAICNSLVFVFDEVGYKVKVVDKSKIRIYGKIYEGRYWPATNVRIVETKGLKKEEIPRVKSSKKKTKDR